MMSEFYYLKATFPQPLKKKEIIALKNFFKEMYNAADYWQEQEKDFRLNCKKLFPTIALYLKGANMNNLSGTFLYKIEDDDLDLDINGTELIYRGYEQSSYLDLDRLANFLKSHFGTIDVRYMSESEMEISDYIDMEMNNEIIEDILKHKEILPTLLRINPILDAKIAEALK